VSKKNAWRGSAFAKKPAVIATEIALAMMATQFAYAQAVQTAERVERVEVTGTRLPQLSTEGVSPVTVLNAEDIRFDGLAKTEDLINNLPQVYAAEGSSSSNAALGTATVSLRGLGANRNLVLVNGRRLPIGSPASGLGYTGAGSAADLNQIPAPLIQRVELLTGGASAVYGSDAISGVVNFIMNDKFEGIRVDVNHSFYNHKQQNPSGVADVIAGRALTNPTAFVLPGDVTSDGDVHQISLLMGGNFASGKGNATLFFDYKREDPVLQATRDFSACALLGDTTGFLCGGSSTSFPGRFFNQATGVSRTVLDAAGNTRAFASATDQFNFGPLNYYRRPAEKYAFNAFTHLDVTPNARAYGEFGFHDNRSLGQIAPSGIFFGSVDFSGPNAIRFENPLLSADWRAQLGLNAPGDTANVFIGRRNIEGGGRADDLRQTSFRWVLGLKGDLWKNWNYDLFMQTAKVIYQEQYNNDFSKTRIFRAMNVVTDPATGQPVCQSVLDGTDANCVPYDIWRLGGVTGAALNYLQIPLMSRGQTQLQVQGGTLSADLGAYGIKVPTAKNGVGIVVGFERRKERLALDPDLAYQTFEGAGQGGPLLPVNAKTSVNEAFGEVRVPLVEGRQLADLLSVSGSYRRSRYVSGIKTNTYGIGAEWAPISKYRIRGSYQHAVRAANIVELFAPAGLNLFDMSVDPCGPAQTATLAQCLNTGLPAALYGDPLLDSPAGQFNFLQGGTATLTPERADTYTLGLVFTPTKDLTGTIDWWSIKIADAINATPAAILNTCLLSAQRCNLVQRDSFGTLWVENTGRVVAFQENTGGYYTNGIDVALNYNHRLGAYGSLGINFLGTWTGKWELEPAKGFGKFDCVGLFGTNCGTPNPEWRHKARATWRTPWNLDLALTWRHISSVLQEQTSSNPLLNGTVFDVERKFPARDYLDIAAAWTVDKSLTVRAGVNNVTDKDPPLTSIAGPSIYGNGNTFPQVYDTLGRLVYVNLTAKW